MGDTSESTWSSRDLGLHILQEKVKHQQAIAAVLAHKIFELGHSADYVKDISEGPIVTVFRFMPKGSTRVSHLEGLAQDFAITLGVEDVVVKRIPGESSVSIFVPNKERKLVEWKNTLNSFWKVKDSQRLPLNLGVDHLGRPVVVDLCDLPHLLVAGSTGSGKSTLLSSILASIVYGVNSTLVKFVLSDTKGVEFPHFSGAPHLLFENATSVEETIERFNWLINEMEGRLKQLAKYGLRNIGELNSSGKTSLPYILVVIDELADLLSDRSRPNEDRGPSLGKIAEEKLAKLAAKARASGIHIIASTQRPSVKMVEGNIKANFPARLSFRLPGGPDSRTVLGTEGAEHLLSRGDMLFVNPNRPGIQRLHAPYANIEDIIAAVDVASRR